MKLFQLVGEIFIDNDKANKSIGKTDSLGTKVASTLGKGVKSAAKWGVAITGAALAAGTAVYALANKTAATTDRIDKMSQKLGFSREGFQEWEYVLSQNGMSIDSLGAGMKTLTNQVDDLKNGSKTATDAFEALGLKYEDLEGLTQEEIFEKTISALQDVGDETKRAAIANDLLGKSGQELTPLLNQSKDAIEELKDKAKEMGMVLSDDTVDAGVKLTDTLDTLKRSFGGIVANIGGAVMPMVQKFAEFILNNMPMIKEVFTGLFSSLTTAVVAFLPILMDLITKALPPFIEMFSLLIANVLPILIELFGTIVSEIFPAFVELLTVILQRILPVFIDLLEVVINTVLPPLLQLFTIFIEKILPPLIMFFAEIVETLLPPLIDLFVQIINTVMPVLIKLFDTFATTVLPPLLDLIKMLVEVILPPLLAVFMDLAVSVLPLVMTVFEALLPIIEPAMQMIASVITIVLALIKGDWEGVWNGIKDFTKGVFDFILKGSELFENAFKKIFEGIKKVIRNIWDGIVSDIKASINFIIKGINSFIKGINKIQIPDWVPGLGGKGLNIGTIPLLANGGDILTSGKVIVGDGGPELLDLPKGARVTPLGKTVPGIIINNPKFFNQEDIDNMMGPVFDHLKNMGLNPA